MWIDETIRLRPEAIKLYEYLQITQQKTPRKFQLMDMIVSEKLQELKRHTYTIDEYQPMRQVKGFKLRDCTIQEIDEFVAKRDPMYLKAEVIEICLYIYAKENLSETDFDNEIFKLNSWNVRKL